MMKKNSYAIPFDVLRKLSINIFTLPLLVGATLIIFSFILLIANLIFNKIPGMFYAAQLLFVMGGVLIILFGLLRIIFFGSLHSPLCKWALENVKCPACNGKIKSCKTDYFLGFWKRWRGRTHSFAYFLVECEKCDKKFLFEASYVHPLYLLFLNLKPYKEFYNNFRFMREVK